LFLAQGLALLDQPFSLQGGAGAPRTRFAEQSLKHQLIGEADTLD